MLEIHHSGREPSICPDQCVVKRLVLTLISRSRWLSNNKTGLFWLLQGKMMMNLAQICFSTVLGGEGVGGMSMNTQRFSEFCEGLFVFVLLFSLGFVFVFV